MRQERPETRTERRSFLKLAGLGAAASTVAAVATGGGSAQAVEARPASQGYRETPHVKKVYELARF